MLKCSFALSSFRKYPMNFDPYIRKDNYYIVRFVFESFWSDAIIKSLFFDWIFGMRKIAFTSIWLVIWREKKQGLSDIMREEKISMNRVGFFFVQLNDMRWRDIELNDHHLNKFLVKKKNVYRIRFKRKETFEVHAYNIRLFVLYICTSN